MDAFRRLMTVVLIAGAAAGLLLAAVQHVTVGPLIYRAEGHEHAGHEAHASERGTVTPEEWQLRDGVERIVYTVLGTALTGIAFAAVLFGIASALGLQLNFTRGLLLGLVGFACCALAPAIGVPPKPPGAAAADLHAAQIWCVSSAIATAVGLWTIGRSDGSWIWRVGGMFVIALPHLIGAPAPIGSSPIPPELSRQFAIASVATQAIFWIKLGGLGGLLYARAFRSSSMERAR
jgi:cobalt transporter subunit CbtA